MQYWLTNSFGFFWFLSIYLFAVWGFFWALRRLLAPLLRHFFRSLNSIWK